MTGSVLTDADRYVLAEARRLGPDLRASGSDRDRLAGWLLAQLVAIIERQQAGCDAEIEARLRSEDGTDGA